VGHSCLLLAFSCLLLAFSLPLSGVAVLKIGGDGGEEVFAG
jgi:hypothetical protein